MAAHARNNRLSVVWLHCPGHYHWYGSAVCFLRQPLLRPLNGRRYRHYSRPTPTPVCTTLPLSSIPHITIIRPIAGIEPCLYDCLASTFQQSYPSERLAIYFCVSSIKDPSLPILQSLLSTYPSFDARIFIEDEDPNLNPAFGGARDNLGPNPKIRNMSRAYREAKGEVIWIVDCNVWVSASAAGLMVDLLCGFAGTSKGRKYKFVHQLPVAVDVSADQTRMGVNTASGTALDTMFLSTSHAKFYTAISTVAIAPCTVGKSNMFRRAHLDALTQPSPSQASTRAPGIDLFSDNICEDHLLSDLLWRSPVPAVTRTASFMEGRSIEGPLTKAPRMRSWGNHGLLVAPPCIQPMDGMALSGYVARRTRWLRVRKFTVPAATLVEPATESLFVTMMLAWAVTTLPWCRERLGVPSTWKAFWAVWVMGVVLWSCLDRWVYGLLQGWKDEGGADGRRPVFLGSGAGKSLSSWCVAWFGREVLAFWVWAWAILGGTVVVWRGRRFQVGLDARVKEIPGRQGKAKEG